MDKIERVKELTQSLNLARDEYYNNSNSIMSDYQYDSLVDELKVLERETGFCLSNSPTKQVGYEVKSRLQKVEHSHPMLSLDKTKSIEDLVKFCGNKTCVLMHKLDGLTISLEYKDGELIKAETRGDGRVGEEVLHNAKAFKNIPLHINHRGTLVVDGEAVISNSDFRRINETLPDEERYKHPRNLASGSVRQLDSKVAAQRYLHFIAWKCIKGFASDSHVGRLLELTELGFETVPYSIVLDSNKMEDHVKIIKENAKIKDYPIDGLVLGYDSISYGQSLGATGHHLKSQIAFKFYDEEAVTRLRDIEWSMGKTGVLTPVALFDIVELDGTEVGRASLHNVSIIEDLKLGIGDEITIFKSNQIIPQVRDNLTQSKTLRIPDSCPFCGGKTTIQQDNDSKILICTNPNCKGKLLGQFTNFVSKPAMNIDGLSEATLEKFIQNGWIKTFKDIYHLDRYKDKIVNMSGFGEKSYTKLIRNIESSRNVKLENYLVALGIPNIGKTASKTISRYFNGNYFAFIGALADGFDFTQLNDFGQKMNDALTDWLNESDGTNEPIYGGLDVEMKFQSDCASNRSQGNSAFTGKTVVVTGSLEHFTRESIQDKLEELGAVTSGSVSKKTDYLIAGEKAGSKLTKARKCNVIVLTEAEFLNMINEF